MANQVALPDPTPVGTMTFANLPKLDGSNYQSWRDMQEIALEIKGLKSAITEEQVEPMLNLKAKLSLLESMNESHRSQVRGCSSAKQIFDRLELIYNDKSAANIYRLLHQYYRYDKLQSDSMSEHIGRMDEMRNKLADLGEKQTDAVYQVTLIGSLPPEYATIMEAWELTHPDMRTTERLVSRLLKREEDLKKDPARAMVVKAGTSLGNQPPSLEKKEGLCYYCKEKGHIKRDCELLNKKKTKELKRGYGHSSSNPVAPQAHMVNEATRTSINFVVPTINPRNLKNLWVCDSGATSHMCNNSSWFDTMKRCRSLGRCYMGDGESAEIEGMGTVACQALIGDSWQPIILNKVLFVPKLAANLLSVGQAGESGVVTTFSGGKVIMMKDDMEVANGDRIKDGLYLMRMQADSATPKAFSAAQSLEEYHRILGHAGSNTVQRLLKGLGIPTSDNKVDCSECPGGKGKHASHPSKGHAADGPGVVHVDLSGVVNKPNSLEGFKYYMLCKDEFSEFDMIYFCRDKGEVPKLLNQLLIDFETLSGHCIREIHSDQGSEFKNRVTELLFAKEKVKHVMSAPYCPQQNGRAEREIQTITNMARTMLIGSNLTRALWPQALETAVHVKNRLPTSRSDLTPNERLTGSRPSIGHLVEFGTPVHVIINDSYLTKWDTRTTEGFVVGFTRRRNTYSVFLPSKGRVIESCDVIFAKHKEGDHRQTTHNQQTNQEQSVTVPLEQARDAAFEPDDCSKEGRAEDQETQSGFDTGYYNEQEANRETRPTVDRLNNGPPFERTNRATSPFIRPMLSARQLEMFFEQYLREDRREEGDYEEIGRGIGQLGMPTDQPGTVEPRASSYSPERAESMASVSTPVRPDVPPPLPPYRPTAPIETPIDSTADDGGPVYSNAHDEETNVPTNRSFLAGASEDIGIPANYTQAINSSHCSEWQTAIDTELAAHELNNTWDVADRPQGKRVLSTKWVFAIKRDIDGNIDKFKARLVVRGYEQRPGIDFSHTFAPVARLESIRVLLALVALRDLTLRQFDVSTAFLHGKIEEEVFIESPAGFRLEGNKCFRLNKALYGLKQAPRAWNSTFDSKMREIGFKPTLTDMCVYTNSASSVILAIYVDDGIVIAKDAEECDEVISRLETSFKLKRLAGNFFLGLEITRTDDSIFVGQARYVDDMMRRFKMADAQGASSPLVNAKALLEKTGIHTNAPYREAIGSLQYLACSSRPDLLFAVSYLSKFNKDPEEQHWTAVKRVLRYVKTTSDYCLQYKRGGALTLDAFSDADWANDNELCRSTSGVLVQMGGNTVIFSSRKQSSDIAQSSAEAEYIAANEATKELKWLTQFLGELNYAAAQTRLVIDNLSTIQQIQNNETKRRSKHIDIKYHFVREEHRKGLFELKATDTHSQLADFLTKPLSGPQLEKLTKNCNMNKKPSKLIIAATVIALLCLHCPDSAANEVQLVEPLIHVDSIYEVADFVTILTSRIVFPQLCQVTGTRDGDSTYNIKKNSYDALTELCLKAYNDLSKTLEEIATCLPQSTIENMLNRIKRWIEPFTTIFITLSIMVVVWAIDSTIEYFDPNSTQNLALKANAENLRQDNDMREAKREFERAKDVRQDMTKYIETTANRSRDNMDALMQSPAIHTNVAFDAAKVVVRLNSVHEGLEDIGQSCKTRRLNIRGLNKIVRIKELADAREEHTELRQLKQIDNRSLFIEARAKMISRTTKILRVTGVPHWANYTRSPTYVEYSGPDFAIHNSTANCTRGIEQPRGLVSFERCEEQDYRDPALDQWTPYRLSEKEAELRMRPTVIETNTANIVYCLYKNITINGFTAPCPVRPLAIPKSMSFDLGQYKYEVHHIHIDERATTTMIEAIKVTNLAGRQQLDDAEMLRTIKDKEAKTVQAGVFSFENNTLTIPSFSKDHPLLAMAITGLTIISALITIGHCMGRRLGTSSSSENKTETETKEEEHTESHAEQITIINAMPQDHEGYHRLEHYNRSTDNQLASLFNESQFRTLVGTLAQNMTGVGNHGLPHSPRRPPPPPPKERSNQRPTSSLRQGVRL